MFLMVVNFSICPYDLLLLVQSTKRYGIKVLRIFRLESVLGCTCQVHVLRGLSEDIVSERGYPTLPRSLGSGRDYDLSNEVWTGRL